MTAPPPTVLGVAPRLPPTLQNWAWLTAPVRAERAAAFRVAVGAVLLLDVLVQYLPHWKLFYGPDGIGSPDIHAEFMAAHWARWSLLAPLPASWGPPALLALWAVSAVGLIVGYRPRLMALVAWVLAVSFFNSHPYLHNGGDRIKIMALLMLAFLPSDGRWAVRKHPAARTAPGPVFVHPWPMRLMFIHLCTVYFFNGYYKFIGPGWRDGTVLHYVTHDPGWTHWSGEFFPMPPLAVNVLCWVTVIWELGFPLWVILKPTRNITLVIGVAFHLITFLHLEVGLFPLYAICGYVPILAWETWRQPKITSPPSPLS